ncbi:hypothetical protein [Micavibrio aeruginosavorus]|uniref:Uncharacterized protein n=1 Tax=Micavibrio aeruginosavorus (strain ARL-13) TaxID=856793 RepID=G2KPB3_MICAA|nr:hypothetical protein [Micavibrio aeruginosavorus]AEP09014.1 hypothetical protein MICA_680 [Micavibrio aeruginosavorus ARL-13]
MTASIMCVVFRPAHDKNIGDVSRMMPVIEQVIADCDGLNFSEDVYDSSAFRFFLPSGANVYDADRVVQCLNRLNDHDGGALLEAEQVSVPEKSVTLTRYPGIERNIVRLG